MNGDDDKNPFKRPEGQPVARAINALREGRPSDDKCYFCGGKIVVIGYPPGGPYTTVDFHCPCGKSNGRLKGI
jgi:hypothetical protein